LEFQPGDLSLGGQRILRHRGNDPLQRGEIVGQIVGGDRHAGYCAQGVHVAMVFTDLSWWHQGRKFDVPVYTDQEIFVKAQRLLNGSGYAKVVRNLAVSVYDLVPSTQEQLELFSSPKHKVSEAMDRINDRWGEFVVTPALMMGMEDIILDRISFGGVKELRELYE
jgi:DNA polymerase-4